MDAVRLWHDDVRPAPDGWVWAKTNAEAMEILAKSSVIEASLDHDMGAVVPQDMSAADAMNMRGTSEDNGQKLVEWMIENGLVPEIVTIHSWNFSGGQEMMLKLRYAGYPCIVKPFNSTVAQVR